MMILSWCDIVDFRSVYDPRALETRHKIVLGCPGSLVISRSSKSRNEGRTYRSTLGRESKTSFSLA